MACFYLLFSFNQIYRAVVWTSYSPTLSHPTSCASWEASTILPTSCPLTQGLTQLLRKYFSKKFAWEEAYFFIDFLEDIPQNIEFYRIVFDLSGILEDVECGFFCRQVREPCRTPAMAPVATRGGCVLLWKTWLHPCRR